LGVCPTALGRNQNRNLLTHGRITDAATQVSTVIRQKKAQGQLCQIYPSLGFEIGFRNILWYTGTLVIDAEQNKFSIVFKINCYRRVRLCRKAFSTRLETTLQAQFSPTTFQSLDISIFGFICKFILFSEKVIKHPRPPFAQVSTSSLSRIKYKSLVGFYLSSECIQNV